MARHIKVKFTELEARALIDLAAEVIIFEPREARGLCGDKIYKAGNRAFKKLARAEREFQEAKP